MANKTIYIPDEQEGLLENASKISGMSQSSIILKIITEYITAYNGGKKPNYGTHQHQWQVAGIYPTHPLRDVPKTTYFVCICGSYKKVELTNEVTE